MDLDDALRFVASPYRRQLVLTLMEANPEGELDLPKEMAGDDEEVFEMLVMEMYHNHLPKLERAGVIEWDRESQEIRRGPKFQELMTVCRLLNEHQDELPEGWV